MDIYGVIHNQYAAALEDYSLYETDLPLYTREAMSGVVRLLSQACTCGSTAEVAKYLEPLIRPQGPSPRLMCPTHDKGTV